MGTRPGQEWGLPLAAYSWLGKGTKQGARPIPHCMTGQMMGLNGEVWSGVHYILTGIEKGFRIGFSDTEVTRHSAERNLLSASSNPEVVSTYLAEVVTLGWVVGPLPPQQMPGVHIRPFGVIPKGHTSGK